MKRAYIFKSEPTTRDFFMRDNLPVWNLGEGLFQTICDDSNVPDWAKDAVDIRQGSESSDEKVASVCSARKAECSLMKASVAVGKGGVEEVAAPSIIPFFVMMGDCPEDIVKQDEVVEKGEDINIIKEK